ncbi:alpha/beta hydrolase [Litorilituus lipolyticus]|uniref:Alpha/beta fold hydrolase n=1 Tax=Litorilituus lipolyticus TaxID=2491017 RepID=A0A502KVZ5_9GAMM|nr:alpha/beta fold hydrolase [Litorilituus lipolyticus]TPH15636.1 alpha/beta fold hydrolase [Litorilituus lipolyticus]
MNLFSQLFIGLLIFISPTLFAKQATCLDFSFEPKAIEQHIAAGKYRESHYPAAGKEIEFSFSPDLSFEQYIQYSYQLIESKNPRAELPCPIYSKTFNQLATVNSWPKEPTIAQLIAPFELAQPDTKKAVLLIHGLTDSPYSYHDLAQFFYQQGFTVRTLLLPGHGTAPSALRHVSYRDWQLAAKYGIERTVRDFDQVYLGGFSTGGALIFDYFMHKDTIDKKIAGLFMWSPASKAKSDMAWLAQYVDYIPFVDWIDLSMDADFAKYESFPYNAAAQVHSLMSRIVGENASSKRKMHDIPLFLVASEHDQTIETKQTFVLVDEWQQGKVSANDDPSRFVFYGDKDSIPEAIQQSISVINPTCETNPLCEKIVDIAHTATTNSPENPHYGVLGQYRNCEHYIKDIALFSACKTNEGVVKGELTEENLANIKVMQRLTYNPHYQAMLTSLKGFIAAIE